MLPILSQALQDNPVINQGDFNMSINNPVAIKFSNERVRASSDQLAQCYYHCDAARDRWDSLGGGSGAIAVMETDIRGAADRLVYAYEFCFRTEKLWFLLGGTSLIPNSASSGIVDGSPADGRPAVTGQQAVSVIDRVVQLQNWLFSPSGNFADSSRNNASWYNTVLAVSTEGSTPMTVADAGNFMTRCSEIRTRYEANNNQELGTILAYSPNPNA
jgi:hypothetical protein